MMSLLKVKDNSINPIASFSSVKVLTDKIANKTLEELEREGIFVFPEILGDVEDINGNQMILETFNDSYVTSNVMGFLGCEDKRLIIESRFSSGDEDYFFQYLLSRVFNFPNVLNTKADADDEARLFNFLIFLFPYYLREAMRKGLFKEYICNDYNDDNVKGTIEVARHIKVNTPFTGNIAYSMREFTYDNPLMELVRHTIEFIKTKKLGNMILKRVRDEVALVIGVTKKYAFSDRQKIINENKKNTIRHAYYKEYLALQRLCLLILRYQKHQIGLGTKQIYGILFDGAWLWEEYIYSLIGDVFHHPMNKARKEAQRLFDRNTGLIYPDFISIRSDSRIIADAKYKPMENIGNKDYLQLLAYMLRFEAKTGYYLYPNVVGDGDLKLRLNQGSTYEKNVKPREDIFVKKHGLNIPVDVSSYDEFATRIKVSEEEFKREFRFLISETA